MAQGKGGRQGAVVSFENIVGVGARYSGPLRDLRVFVDHSAESVTSDDLDIASFGVVQWS